MKSLLKVLVLIAVAGWMGIARADSIPDHPIPHQLNVQGVLRNAGGEVVNGTYNVVFTLWDQQTGGSVLFNSGTQVVTVTGGVFNTYLNLGSTDPFKNRDSVWLQIQIGSDPPLPRRPITSVGFAYQAEHAEVCDEALAADSLVCVGCVTDTQLGVNYAGSTSKGGPATALSCTGCIGSTHLADGGIATVDIGDLQVTTAKIAAGAVDNTKIANDAVRTQHILNGQVMTDDLADGAVTAAKIAAGAVTAGKLGVNWALGVSAGGDAAGLQCTACVEPSEVTFNFAGSTSKGGAASDLACDATQCVSSAEVNFNYAGSTSKGGPATSLSCTDCITAGMVQFNYAGSLSEGGAARDLECSPAGCVGDADLGVNYALGVSKGGPAANLQCTACVQDSELELKYAFGDAQNRAINVECSGCIGATDIAAGVITNTHVSATADIAGTKIQPGTTSARGTFRAGVGLTVDATDRLNVVFAGTGSANTAARSDHTHTGYLTDGGPYRLNQGNQFIFVDPDAPAPNEVYLHNPSGANSVVVELRLTQPGQNASTSREFRIRTESANIIGETHRFYATGDAYHYGGLTLGGALTCTGCVNSAAILDGTIQNADIANVSGAKIQSNTSIDLGNGDVTARYMWAFRFYDRDNTAYYMDPASDSYVSSIFANNWFRAQGTSGLYFQDYGGGWHMTDSTWIRAYNNKPVYADNEIRSGNNMRAPIFYDLNDGGFYVDPNSNSRMVSLYVNNNLINWPGYGAGIVQAPGAYLYPGRADGGTWQTSWYLASHGSYGLYTNTGLYVASNFWAPHMYDANNSSFYIDPAAGSQVHTIYANNWFRSQGQTGWYNESYGGGWYMTDTTWIRAYNSKSIWTPATMQADTQVNTQVVWDLSGGDCKMDPNGITSLNNVFIRWLSAENPRLWNTRHEGTTFNNGHTWHSGDVAPSCNGCYWNGLWPGHLYRAWGYVVGYNIWGVSGRAFKKDIRELRDSDLDEAIRSLRKIRSIYFRFNEETDKHPWELPKDADPTTVARARAVPHLGVIAETLPANVRAGANGDAYSLADMDGFLVAAIKAIDRRMEEEIRNRDQRILELEDRVALLEQVLVDAGILK